MFGGGGASKARELGNSTNLLKVLISSKATVWGALRASFTPRAMYVTLTKELQYLASVAVRGDPEHGGVCGGGGMGIGQDV